MNLSSAYYMCSEFRTNMSSYITEQGGKGNQQKYFFYKSTYYLQLTVWVLTSIFHLKSEEKK